MNVVQDHEKAGVRVKLLHHSYSKVSAELNHLSAYGLIVALCANTRTCMLFQSIFLSRCARSPPRQTAQAKNFLNYFHVLFDRPVRDLLVENILFRLLQMGGRQLQQVPQDWPPGAQKRKLVLACGTGDGELEAHLCERPLQRCKQLTLSTFDLSKHPPRKETLSGACFSSDQQTPHEVLARIGKVVADVIDYPSDGRLATKRLIVVSQIEVILIREKWVCVYADPLLLNFSLRELVTGSLLALSL